ncbi:MAG: hypothetical protein LBP22_08650 [Deltaproteobacteria bacterium]|jgi:hypothetical protein|nr:hypothetical protein [Deltaproteobacteria bacterium]
MAKSVLNWKDRRTLSESAKSQDVLLKAGEELLAADCPAEAADFFRKAGAQDKLESLMYQAMGEGNFFLYNLAVSYLGREPKVHELDELIRVADLQGLSAYSRRAGEVLAKLKAAKSGSGQSQPKSSLA